MTSAESAASCGWVRAAAASAQAERQHRSQAVLRQEGGTVIAEVVANQRVRLHVAAAARRVLGGELIVPLPMLRQHPPDNAGVLVPVPLPTRKMSDVLIFAGEIGCGLVVLLLTVQRTTPLLLQEHEAGKRVRAATRARALVPQQAVPVTIVDVVCAGPRLLKHRLASVQASDLADGHVHGGCLPYRNASGVLIHVGTDRVFGDLGECRLHGDHEVFVAEFWRRVDDGDRLLFIEVAELCHGTKNQVLADLELVIGTELSGPL
mmetsp:Transcript_59464/g.138508  ORF Transcript_59464/g.138508 Transcript_59464/m.138508 type:complete len:263 (+) Transcript_59464:127-915(+)